ncbi:MAG: PLP-dependent aminotransferase family protein [Eubacterium sp.]|nr:PLP-dependent aminotransferase family protein [Eubacterium sp.]
MLSYSFLDDKKVPLYEQLYQFIRDDIMEGRLDTHSILPSKRSLAKQLSISITTVENAYNQLVSEGYIYSKPKSGYYVSDIPTAPSETNRHNESSYIHGKTAPVANEKEGIPEYYADFSSNANDPATFPFSTWAKINREILSTEQTKLMTNSPSNGLMELRYAIADYLREFRSIYTSPDNIVVGAGTETLYSLLVQLLGFNLTYAVENPGYEKIYKMLSLGNLKVKRIPMDEFGIIPTELINEDVNVIHTTPSHHFPTGITMPVSRRNELLSWANTSDKYIIEDDYDSEFRFSGRPIPSLTSIDRNEKVVYMNTFTKSLASTIRISYMVLPDHLRDQYHEKLSFYSCPVSTFEQLTLALFISKGYYEKHINRMRTASRKKRDLLLKTIKSSPIARFSEISEEQSGLHFILHINLEKEDTEFIEACLEKDIHIEAIAKNSFMINYSSIPLDRIEEAVRRLAGAAC